jgi:hypothetical protein
MTTTDIALMKTYLIETRIPPMVVKEFEAFFDGMIGDGAKQSERRLRDLIIDYSKTQNAKQDNNFNDLLSDMYFYFMLLDACQDWEVDS